MLSWYGGMNVISAEEYFAANLSTTPAVRADAALSTATVVAAQAALLPAQLKQNLQQGRLKQGNNGAGQFMHFKSLGVKAKQQLRGLPRALAQ
jgi:hypothetical protein